ncbi:MAG: hypothetical protein H6562_24910 [Lewinellaceae bacterium]|nr:hypothetical protein [Lewinella sp.]MCB9282154.1 hypothetical protein [Lewinellaceae bacterium]
MTLETRKYQLIERITGIQDKFLISKLEEILTKNSGENSDILSQLVKPLDENLDIDKLIKEQGFTGIDRSKFDRLINEIDIQEPIEDLLKMI